MKLVIITLVFIIFTNMTHAVIFPDRNILYNPFDYVVQPDDDPQSGPFYSMYGWGEFDYYISRSDTNHFWNAKLGAYVELYRYKNKFSVFFNSDIELVANSDSDINFQPRAFFWQQSIFFMNKQPNFTWGLGFSHRCKHDVDNLNYFVSDGSLYARVMIWSSITTKLILNPIVIQWTDKYKFSATPYFENHYYVILTDGITRNYGDRYFTYKDLVDSVAIGAKIDLFKGKIAGLYFNPYFVMDIYSQNSVIIFPLDIILETGVEFYGRYAGLQVFLRYEKFFDAGIMPYYESGQYLLIGIKLS